MRFLVESSLKLRFLVLVLAAALMAFGIMQLRTMPVDVLPEFMPPYVEVQTEALGLSAAEMEALITVPMEADLLNGVAWLDHIYSESVAGLSSILLVFEPGTDPIRARQMVQERLTQAYALPNVSKPPVMLQPLASTSRVMLIGLSSQDVSPIELGVLARWTIKPRLMGVPGVANVAIWGQRERQLQVQVDPQRLRERGVTLQQVIATTGEALWVSPLSYLEASTPGTAGWIDTPNQRLGIRHILPIRSAEDLAQVAIEGTELRLGDVTDVVEDHQPLIGDAVLRDGLGLLLVVEKFPGANTLEVTRGVEEALEAMRPGLKGIQIDTTVFRPATAIELAIGNLGTALLIGAVLAALVLGALLFQWRAALIALVVIPLSLLVAGLVLHLRGATFNMMVLAGLTIALGAIIDDAIVGVENIVRRFHGQRQAGDERSTPALVLEAALEVRRPLAYATLALVLVGVPLLFVPGMAGAFLQPLALTYALALLASLAIALIVTPALSLLLLPKASPARRQSPLLALLQRGYEKLLTRIARAPRRVLVGVGVIVLIGLTVVPFFEFVLLPPFKQTDLLVQWESPPGTSLPEMNRIVAQLSRDLRAIPGVRNVGSHVGRAVTGDRVVDVNSGVLWVSIDPAADYRATTAAIREVVDGYPGFVRDVETYLKERLRVGQLGAEEAIVVRIYGHELNVLRAKAAEVRQRLAQIDGIVDPQVATQPEEPQVEIEVDLAAAERFGLKPGDVRRAAATLLSGLQVGNLYEEQKVFDVVVWGVPELRRSLTSIRELLIDTPGGGHVRLGDVARVRIAPTPIVIKRDAVSRYIDVEADVRGRDLGSVVREVEQALQAVEFPLEYHAELRGEYAAQQVAQRRVIGVAIAAAIAIFLLLQAAFASWRLAAVCFLSLPVALVGGVLAAFIVNGSTVALGSLAGLITVLGIAVRNSVLLVQHYQQLEQHEGEAFGLGLVLRGARERAAPTLMAAATIAAIFLPLALFGDATGFEIVHPIAVAVLGGLVTTILLTLFVVPALYFWFGARTAPASSTPYVAVRPAAG